MTRSILFRAIAPISVSRRGDARGKRVLSELRRARSIKGSLADFGDFECTIGATRDLTTLERDLLKIESLSEGIRAATLPSDTDLYLCLSATCETIKDAVKEEGKVFKYSRLCLEIFYKYVTVLAMCTAGGLRTESGIILAGEKYVDRIQSLQTYLIDESSEYAEEQGLPRTRMLPFDQAWAWATAVEGFRQEFSTDCISRALNMLTYPIFTAQDDGVGSLLWTLMALEAIYARGSDGISYQMKEKITVFLGKKYIHNKKVAGMYGTRSRLIHGDVNVPTSFTWRDWKTKYLEYEIEVYDASLYATYLLINTFHKLIKEGLAALDFKYRVL